MDLPEFFGLDIGNHAIKVAQVRRRNGESQLMHVSSVNIDFNLLTNPSDQGLQELADKIKAVKDAAGIRTPNCVAGIPEAPVFSRLLTLPKMGEDKLEESVHWELKPLIPVPVSDVDVAFLEIGERDLGGQKMIDIFAVAAPKALTERYKQVVEIAGLNLLALETEALANTRLVTYNYPESEKDFMIFDFGASGTDLVLAREGVPVFTQNISTGSDALTKAIAADYGIDIEQAEKYKRAFGLDASQGDGKIAAAITPVMQILLTEMQRTLAYFREKLGDTSVKQVYLCGQGAKLIGLDQYLRENINLEPQHVDPMKQIKPVGEAVQDAASVGIEGFTVALGLALKDR